MNVEDCLFVCIELLMLENILSIIQLVLGDIFESWTAIIEVNSYGGCGYRDLPVVVEKLGIC